jgi:outer membrane receptor protein involved in Fe transport
VTVDQNDHISLKGKQGVNVMIDGRTQPISADELANMLKSMPSSTIEKIEIISNPSAKYDAAGTGGIINIVTKKNKKMGFNGTLTSGYGQGVYPKQNAGMNLNYRNNKLNMYLNYSESYRTGFHHVSFNREFYEAGIFNTEYVQDNYGVLQFQTHNVAVGLDYNISPKTSLGAALNGESFFLGTNGHFYSNVLGPNYLPQSTFITQNTSGGNWDNFAPNVHLKHQFDTSGKELTIDADYARYWNNNVQDFTTKYFLPSGAPLSPPYVLHADINGTTQIRSIKADYMNPLPKNAKWEAGFKSCQANLFARRKF